MPQTRFVIASHGAGLTDFTREVVRWIAATDVRDGLLTLFVRHTSCSPARGCGSSQPVVTVAR